MKTERIFLRMLAIAGILSACEPLENISDAPEIHFKKYTETTIDTLGSTYRGGSLEFTFQDGDSDFGQLNNDSNLVLIPYQKMLDQTYDSIDYETYGRWFRIDYNDYLDRSGSSVKGEIKVDLLFVIPPPYDTIRYNFYIIDRAGHKSNVDSTIDIAF